MADLDKLDDKHKWDTFKQATIDSCKIVLSASSDVVTILSLGTALSEVTSVKTFLNALYKSLIEPNEVSGTNIAVSNIPDIVGGSFFKKDLSEWGTWLIDTFIPCVGTYKLIFGTTEIETNIIEIVDKSLPLYSLDGISGTFDSKENITGIFFNQ